MNFGARRFSSMAVTSALLPAARGCALPISITPALDPNAAAGATARWPAASHRAGDRHRWQRLLAVILGGRARGLRDLAPITLAVAVPGALLAGDAREKRCLGALGHCLGHHLPAIRARCGGGLRGCFSRWP